MLFQQKLAPGHRKRYKTNAFNKNGRWETKTLKNKCKTIVLESKSALSDVARGVWARPATEPLEQACRAALFSVFFITCTGFRY